MGAARGNTTGGPIVIMAVIVGRSGVGPSSDAERIRAAGSMSVGENTIAAEAIILETIDPAAGCKFLRRSSVSFSAAADTGRVDMLS